MNEDQLNLYRNLATDVVSFHLVHEPEDVDRKTAGFHPDMAHQIFGETEMIFGYRSLSIDIYYLHNSAKAYLSVNSRGKVPDNAAYNADDVMGTLSPWLPENFRKKKIDFLKDLAAENHEQIFGDIIHSFEINNCTYKVTICNVNNSEFKDFHQRFETFIVWYIDGANYIDLDDPRWLIFYVYQEISQDSRKIYSPIGFATIYKFFFYPSSTRCRISQFFVLPPYQKKGIGTHFYTSIFTYIRELPDIHDITVEEPTQSFQNIRDFCDSLVVYKGLANDQLKVNSQSYKKFEQYMQKYKIGKKQAQRVFDILECIDSLRKGERDHDLFMASITQRIANLLEKESRGRKRFCNNEHAPVVMEHIDTEETVKALSAKYFDSLESPVKRLRSYLSENI